MTFEVQPSTLKNAASTLKGLANDIGDAGTVPHLGASRGVSAMPGSAVAKALEAADPASSQAKTVLKSRFDGIGGLLYATAEQFHGTDVDLAKKLDAIGDLNNTAV
ncbi:type VII secretion target [Nocardia sp. CDC160]|uniref:type VII secretion target n=1 Tax=Nocardia sp. CDC160 TaxID=3112166 RepID=UPI002DBA8FF9|nr:type VII secretion target [Nocardia sp. CDC160]MEC3915219.1 type VII secretion target [Nocardia sp. CDC160]